MTAIFHICIFQHHTFIVTELLRGGELLTRIREKKKFTEVDVARILKQIVSAVAHMHQHSIVHRDLKPEVSDRNVC